MYSVGEQAFYLSELAAISVGLFVAGALLLRSTRKKDQAYKWWGWIFYLGAYLCIGLMFYLAHRFQGG